MLCGNSYIQAERRGLFMSRSMAETCHSGLLGLKPEPLNQIAIAAEGRSRCLDGSKLAPRLQLINLQVGQ